MNTKLILTSFLTSTLALAGCELLDFGDTDGDDDDTAEDTGGDEDDDEDDDETDAGEGEGESAGESGGEEPDPGEGEGEAGESADTSGGVDPGPADTGDTGAAQCDVEGLQVCVEENVIAVCIDGEVLGFDCGEVCAEGGGVSAGCGFDEESGVDVCWCDYGGGEGGA